MRLICPNCGAQYEVPEDVIPDGGRDVQCSNCGDTWFQKDPSQDRELSEELEQSLDDAHWEDQATDSTQAPAPEAAPDYVEQHAVDEEATEDGAQWDDYEDQDQEQDGSEPVSEDHHAQEEAFDPDGDDEEETPDAPPLRQPRELDPSVSEILREEAEHEQQARQAESASGLETQPDLGLEQSTDTESQRDREARLRMARMRGLSDEEALGAAAGLAANASRRDLLPDIEEINSSLRKDTDRAVASENKGDAAPAEPRRGGFSRGFLTMILLAVALILLYVYADRIAALVPALGGVLDSYVSAVDSLRSWLDQQVLALMGWLDGMSSEAASDS